MKNISLYVIAVAILVGGGAFWAGMRYGQKNAMGMYRTRNQQFGTSGAGFRNGGPSLPGQGNRGGGSVSGEIIAKDEKSITIKGRDNGSKIVFFSDATQVMKSAAGSFQDLEPGEQIFTTGNANPDGSITAQSIQIRPPLPANQ